MVVTRRQFIAGLAVGGAAASFGIPFALGVSGSTSTGRSLVSRAPLPDLFTRQLRIPPVLAPVRSDSDGDHYEITQRVATAEILPGPFYNDLGVQRHLPRSDDREPQRQPNLGHPHQRIARSHRGPSPWGANATRT